MRTNAALAVSLCLVAAACVSAPKPDPTPAPPVAADPKKETDAADKANRELRLGLALRQIDQRVDRYALLASQPGDEARAERNLLGPALKAHVAEYKPELLQFMADGADPDKRRIAAKALAFSDDPAAVTALVGVLSVKGDVRLLTNATYALGAIGSPATPAEPLLALVRDPDPDVRSNALMALWHVFDAKKKVGASPLDPIAQRTAGATLEMALFDPEDAIVRAHAAAAIGALGDKNGVDPLINLLRDEHAFVRVHTAIALAKLGDEKAIPALLNAIDSSSPGSPRRTVVLSLRSLLEQRGLHPPETLGEEPRAWERFVRESFTPAPK